MRGPRDPTPEEPTHKWCLEDLFSTLQTVHKHVCKKPPKREVLKDTQGPLPLGQEGR